MDSHSSSVHLLPLFTLLLLLLLLPPSTTANLIAQPVEPDQPVNPGDTPSSSSDSGNTVPAFPIQPESSICHLDLSAELFGGVSDACSSNLDRSRCCPVLAAWLYAAYARSALAISPSPAPSPSSGSFSSELPMMPEDNSQKCVNSLEDALLSKNIKLAQPNTSCDVVLCFCGIRLHQIMALSCPVAFNLSNTGDGDLVIEHFNHSRADGGSSVGHKNHSRSHDDGERNATVSGVVGNLEKNCRNSSYDGCTKCLGALHKLKGNGTSTKLDKNSRASQMLSKDCQLMGLTWLLARNKTAYIPTVSAVLRAIMYSPHPHQAKCSPDQENMPLAVDSLQFHNSQSSSSVTAAVVFTTSTTFLLAIAFPVLPLIIMLL